MDGHPSSAGCCLLRHPYFAHVYVVPAMFSFVGARGLSAARRSFTTVADEVAAANLKGFGIFALKQTNDKGWGIFALSNIPRFATVFKALSLARGPVRCSHSVQLDWDAHVQMDLPARFINHSCDANVGIVDNDMGAFDFVALRDLEVGQELTWDYGAAEFHSISIANCLCGSPLCRKDSLGFELAHRNIRQQYGKYYAKYLHSWP
jgi:hypothetical protein